MCPAEWTTSKGSDELPVVQGASPAEAICICSSGRAPHGSM